MRTMSVDDPRAVLEAIGAPPRLVLHGELVAEAAQSLLTTMHDLTLTLDEKWVLAGARLHDAGKVLHPEELDAAGASHEEAGQALLLAHGVDPKIARCCVSHARWRTMDCAFEELLVALADSLWKGVRRTELESKVIDEVVRRGKGDRWTLFVELDSAFERIADEGPSRLSRSA